MMQLLRVAFLLSMGGALAWGGLSIADTFQPARAEPTPVTGPYRVVPRKSDWLLEQNILNSWHNAGCDLYITVQYEHIFKCQEAH
jgi:hypothetical protein